MSPVGSLGVLAVPLPDHAGDLKGGLLVEGLDDGHHGLVLDDHLGGAVKVPEDGEGQVLAHLTDVLQKTGQGHGLADVLHPELPTGVGAGLRHEKSTPICNIDICLS